VNSRQDFAARMSTLELEAATGFYPGAILIDEFDKQIFDDVYRRYVLFNRIKKIKAPGETTGGFTQTALGNARVAPVRNLGFTPTNPTRSERVRRDIKAIVKDIQFGAFDLSVYGQQGNRYGDLEAKDVADQKNAALRLWSTLIYTGDIDNDANEFDGLNEILGAGENISTSESIVDAINRNCAEMVNNKDQLVLPTAIYTNAYVAFMIGQELLALGINVNIQQTSIFNGNNPMQVMFLNTPAGALPVISDPFNVGTTTTPYVYDLHILTEDLVSWQYVEVLGQAGADPKTFEMVLNNVLDKQFKTVMFGALELIGGTTHHRRLEIATRTVVIKPAATA